MREITNCSDYALGAMKLANSVITINNGKPGRKKEYYAWIREGGCAIVPFVVAGTIVEYQTGEFSYVREYTYKEGDTN